MLHDMRHCSRHYGSFSLATPTQSTLLYTTPNMSTVDYAISGLTPTSLSPNASLGSLFDPNDPEHDLRPTNQEVDALLNALEHATNHDSFAVPNDGSFPGKMLDSELQLEPVPMRDVQFSDIITEHSLSGLPGEPLSLDDFPSDSNLLFNLDDQFLQNSMKLDQFISGERKQEMEEKNKEVEEDYQEDPIDYGYGDAAPTLAQNAVEDHDEESYPGKRRKPQRRGSMPTMHIGEYSSHYETLGSSLDDEDDPFEPTPMKEPSQQEENLEVALNSFLRQYGSQDVPQVSATDNDDDEEDAYSVQPEKRRRALRRGSMPTMHVRYSMTDGQQSYSEMYGNTDGNTEPTPTESPFIPAVKVGGRMPRRGSTGSFYAGTGSMSFGMASVSGHNPFAPQQTSQDDSGIAIENPPAVFDPSAMMLRLQSRMLASMDTQKALQTWDKKNGLPKSHSQTMVNSSRSRQQLQSGAILPKWDGTPLISNDAPLGKSKPRPKVLLKSGRVGHAKMKRRMSAPTSGMFEL